MRPVALLLIAGCGRIAFDPTPAGGGASDAGDASDGGGAEGPAVAANRMFITAAPTTGALGGLAGADALCAGEAMAAGLTGTFVAFLSTQTVNAVDRLSGSRGWVRTDGQPALDQTADLATHRVLAPLTITAAGQVRTGSLPAWTGSLPDGTATADTCTDWSSTLLQGSLGVPDSGSFLLFAGPTNCTNSLALYCFEIGANVVVSPRVVAGRIAFLSKAGHGASGLAGMDAVCSSEAQAAGLPGTYLAAAATETTTIRSRFTIDSRPWIRVDGTKVADGVALFDTSGHFTFVNQQADGTYTNNAAFASGALNAVSVGTATDTCTSWTSGSNALLGIHGAADVANPQVFWSNSSIGCNGPQPVLCLQE